MTSQTKLPLKARALIAAYLLITALIPSWVVTLLVRRVAAQGGEEDARRSDERIARRMPQRPAGQVIWLHGIGPGDCTALVGLLPQLRDAFAQVHVLVTTRTVTAQRSFARWADDPGVTVQLAPHDGRFIMRRFLHHWRPTAAIFCERDLWPNGLRGLQRHNAAIFAVNVHLAGQQGREVARHPHVYGWLWRFCDYIHTASDRHRQTLLDIGVDPAIIAVGPNLKRLAPRLPVDQGTADAVRAVWPQAPIVTFGSLHPGEVDIVLDALAQIRAAAPATKAIIAPRWRESAAAMKAACTARGLHIAQRSLTPVPAADDDILLADTYGEMGTWYALADIVMVGGSLEHGGLGHNPYEPLRFGKPLVVGPHHVAFDNEYRSLIADRSCRHVADSDDLAQAVLGHDAIPAVDITAFTAENDAFVDRFVARLRDFGLGR